MENVILKGILDEFTNEFDIELAQDKSFEALINYLVVNRIQSEAVETAEQIISIDVDEGSTFGIDGIAIFVNDNLIVSADDLEACKSKSNTVHFVFTQSKTSNNLDISEVSKFARAVQAFFKDEKALDYSSKIKSKFEIKQKIFQRDFSRNMSKDSPECIMYFAYSGSYKTDPTIEEVLKQEADNIIRENPFLKTVKIILLDSSRIISMYNESINAIEVDIDFKERLSMNSIEKVDDVYYGLLNLKEFYKLIEDDEGNIRSNIFYENVRDYLGDDNPINKEIISTLQSDNNRQYFSILNNGITVITRYIKPISSTKLTIKDYQIVNGCQTSNVLHRCKTYIENSNIQIPIKIIYTVDSNVIVNIIKANNKQSVVPEEAFIALGEYHKELQEFYKQKSKSVSLPIYYERRNREIVNDDALHLFKEQIVTLHAQIRACVSIYYNAPHLVYSNNPNFILKGKYTFFDTEHRYSAYYISSYIVANIRQLFKKRKINNIYHSFIYYIALYFRVFSSGSYKPYYLSDLKIDKEMNKIIGIFQNETETLRIISLITNIIDEAIKAIKNSEKYANMEFSQIAALTSFEDKLKEIYLRKYK